MNPTELITDPAKIEAAFEADDAQRPAPAERSNRAPFDAKELAESLRNAIMMDLHHPSCEPWKRQARANLAAFDAWAVDEAGRRNQARHFDEALAEVVAERDALRDAVAAAAEHSKHLGELYTRQLAEIAVLRTFFARQDATSWAAVKAFDTKTEGAACSG